MIVLDIETSGLDKVKCGIWQIGAIDLDTGEEFFEEGRIDDEDEVLNLTNKSVFEVIGKTEEELRDKNKQSQKELLDNFFKWVENRKIKNFICQNPQFDVAFLEVKSRKYGLKIPFHYRSFDLHSIAQTRYYDEHGKYSLEADHSDMGLKNILEMCGSKDERGKHNALEDARLTAECFKKLKEKKNETNSY